jgi:hypothetical protein
VRGSSANAIVTRWLDNTSDTIGYVSNSGSVTFENLLTVGRLISDGGIALNVSGKRITGVSNPVLVSDAVPFSYLQSYVVDFFEDAVRLDTSTFYNLDGGVY